MDDLLTLAESSAFLKALRKEDPRVVPLPPQSLVKHVQQGTLAGEVVNGALYIHKWSLLKLHGLDAGARCHTHA